MSKQILVATDSGAFFHDGELVVLHKDVTTVREGHPLLGSVPDDLFRPLVPTYEHQDPEDAPEDDQGATEEPEGDSADPETPETTEEPATEQEKPVEPPKDAPVEKVTANPGERRVTRQRRKG